MAVGLAYTLAIGTARAQNSQPSAKVTAKTANLTLLPETTGTGDWQTLLSNTLKTPNQKDLFISASFEVDLFTQTKVSSKNMTSDTSTATANVQVRVLLDGKVVEPGQVVYGRRTQTLTATLEGAIAGCLTIVTNTDGSLSIVFDPNCVAPETIELILERIPVLTLRAGDQGDQTRRNAKPDSSDELARASVLLRCGDDWSSRGGSSVGGFRRQIVAL